MKTSSQTALWDTRYASDDYLFGTEANAFLVANANAIPTRARVLAVADGEGRNGCWLAAQGHDVLAVDASSVALQKAARLAEERGVALRTQQVDLLAWDWPVAQYDAVVAIFIQFTNPEQRAQMFAGMIQALAPGGVLLLQGYRPEQLAYGTGGPSSIQNLYTEPILRDAFASLNILQLRSHDSEIHEGRGHHGMSALIDLVAQKAAGPA